MKKVADTEILKKDYDLLVKYFTTENYDLLDSHIAEIINSNNSRRLEGVLHVFDPYRENKMFKNLLISIEKQIKTNTYDIR